MPNPDGLTIFTHIDKTAGTSFVDSLVRSNVSSERILVCVGARSFILGLRNKPAFIGGHTPFGLHVLTRRKTTYITFLREPIDRAISQYYFARESYDGPAGKHPLCDLANSLDIAEFYQRREVQNLQTRYLAGQLPFQLYPVARNPCFDQILLRRAIKNLRTHYACCGIQERFGESVELVRQHFGWKTCLPVEARMKTRSRVQAEELSPSTIAVLAASNSLDIQLYTVALQIFESRLATARLA